VGVDLPKAVGRRVRELRTQLDVSQEELAARAGLHRNYVGSVERGERDIGITALGRLAGALGVSLDEFFKPLKPLVKRWHQMPGLSPLLGLLLTYSRAAAVPRTYFVAARAINLWWKHWRTGGGLS
jgi:XRE family transcriptional regulator, regulator of sulfur utilization